MKAVLHNQVPRHIAIIPDGNRRWANSKHLPSVFGHSRGVEVGNSLYNGVFDLGVEVLSFWAFSTENWDRPPQEVKHLFGLLEDIFQRWIVSMVRDNIKIVVSGRVEELPVKLQRLVGAAIQKTRHNTRGIINLCLNYGGRAEIVDAMKKIIDAGVPASKITVPLISKYMYTPGLPDTDLIIRTSGEQRLSGYLMWESDYAELVFIKKHFPQLTLEDIKEAIAEYQRRQRRFGA